MSATASQSHAGVSLAMSKARPEGQSSDVARALGRCQALAEARTRAWLARRPTRELTAALETAWADFRQARALLTPDKPPVEHRSVERVVVVKDRRYQGADHVLDRFLLDRCVSDHGARVALSDFAAGLRDYVTDDEERDDLPGTRQLAHQLRARGIAVERVGGVIWLTGVRLDQDENRCSPIRDSHSSSGLGSAREPATATAAASGRKGR